MNNPDRRFVYKLKTMYSSKNNIYYVSRSYLVSYVITNKALILSLLYDPHIFLRSSYFPAKTHVVGKIEIYILSFGYNNNN